MKVKIIIDDAEVFYIIDPSKWAELLDWLANNTTEVEGDIQKIEAIIGVGMFSRGELRNICDRAESQKGTIHNPFWKRELEKLADAADSLDAMLVRSEDNINKMNVKIKGDM